MRQFLSAGLLAMAWLISMAELMLGLDGFLFDGPGAALSGWFILGGASAAGTLTVTAVEDWIAFRSRNLRSKSVIPLPPRCPALPGRT
jgi:hypothetical protein